ncbi:HNH endonuclease [Pseudomonas moorei]|nr:HNH endonuclease [Pseudomonas moorei]
MKNIPMPSRDTVREDLVKAIKRYRYKQQLLGHTITAEEIDQVLAIYDRYDADQGVASDLLKGPRLPRALIDAMEAAYDKTQESRQLYPLRQSLFEGVDLCPICGITPPVELDHFLPRSQFKTLAIYPRNLVPLCHACNHTKLAGFGDEGDDERFLHAYFDIMPDEQFLDANIDIQGGGLIVTFSISDHADLPEGYSERLTRQMTSLRLNDRYEREVNSYISSHAVTLHLQHSVGGQDAVRSFLNFQARFERRQFYLNHWRPTLLSALARHDEFTDGGFAQVMPLPRDLLDDIANP